MILNDELELRLSGGLNNTNPNLSLGGPMSQSLVTDNLFLPVNAQDITNLYNDYRCIYFYNSSSTESIPNLRILMSIDNSGAESDIVISKAISGINGIVSAIINSTTAPINQEFAMYANDSNTLNLGTIPPLGFIGMWLKRTILANPKISRNNYVQFIAKADIN